LAVTESNPRLFSAHPRELHLRDYTIRRNMSGGNNYFEPATIKQINTQKMKELIEEYEIKGREASGMVVIDVRGEDEVKMTGKISQNTYTLPLPYINQRRAFAMDDDDFENYFGFSKPQPDETIVFTCKAGVRSNIAAQIAGMEGYTNLVNYMGGANEWFFYNS